MEYLGAYLYEEVEDSQGYNDRQEDGGTWTDHHQGAGHAEYCVHKHTDDLRQVVVNGLDVPWESIHDTTNGSRVKEGHWRTENVGKHTQMEAGCSLDLTCGKDNGIQKDERRWKHKTYDTYA